MGERNGMSRTLRRWRLALGRMAWRRFLLVVTIATFAAKLLTILPCSLVTNLDRTMDPGRAERLGWVFTVVAGPLFETLAAQALVVWIVGKFTRGSFAWLVVASALFFGAMHYFSRVYVLCMTFVGGVWAFVYLSRAGQGFRTGLLARIPCPRSDQFAGFSRMTRFKLPALLFAILGLTACGGNPAGLKGAERIIADRIREIRELRSGTAAVWPGFDAPEYDTPLLYYTDSVCYAVNPTPQFRAEFGTRTASRTAGIEICKASLPDTLAFHMETQLDIGDSTAFNGRMPFLFCSSPEITARTIPDVSSDSVWLPMVLHEYAHGFQFRQPGFAAAFAREKTSVPQRELAASYGQCRWLREAVEQENALLLAAIAAGTTAERDSCIRSFLTRRRERKRRMAAERGDSTVRMEEIYELMEGMARYVEAEAGFRLGSYTEADDWLFRTDRSAYFYATGYNLIRLLDVCGADKTGLYTGRILPLEEFLTTTENRD